MEKPKVYWYEFGTDTIIDFLNIFAIFVHEKTKLTEVFLQYFFCVDSIIAIFF